ncbi:MAG: replication-associated recombination protein A [Nanoarchaeota archaeon]|nr:replication-associated recombination protein A [Nanoarchaeota archaeon]
MEPLASKVRPNELKDFIFTDKLTHLREVILNKKLFSMLFWGPPGTGKTTLARIISGELDYNFIEISAVNSNLKDMREKITKAKNLFGLTRTKTILFIDEIHRFNKLQQDFLLPFVEKGDITLIGATTENPAFEVNNALLSRLKVFNFEKISDKQIFDYLKKIIKTEKLNFSDEIILFISEISDGDLRNAINTIEFLSHYENLSIEKAKKILNKNIHYNKEFHYDMISAVHKSLRDSDVNASLYWVFRMLTAGEDPKFILRRLVRFASEDIGVVDNHALEFAVKCFDAHEYVGLPESNVIIAQLVIYLAKAKKSNKVYETVTKLQKLINETGNLEVPLDLRNPEKEFLKNQGYGKNYKYIHDLNEQEKTEYNINYLPKKLKDVIFYKD